jgi:adenosylmethionine-8-amino-7-oxononanoate aminotransferase
VPQVRGHNLLAGFDSVANKESGPRFVPERVISQGIQDRAREHRVIVRAFDDDMFGLDPPLVITRAEVDALVDGIKKAIDDVRREEEGVG